MNAEEFFRMKKDGRKMENEYFIAMEKTSFFRMMEEYANLKCKEEIGIKTPISYAGQFNQLSVLKNN